MNINNIINKIIKLPETFYLNGNVSIYNLLRDSGYFEMYDQIDENNILEELTKHPEYVKIWLEWSDNKRTDSGWFFQKSDHGKYTVDYFPKKEKSDSVEYEDSKLACATFIKLELEAIRKS